MAFSTTVIAVLSVLTVFHLLLTFGVIRRLRQHTELIEECRRLFHAGPEPAVAIHDGEVVGDFTARTIGGDTIDRSALVDHRFIGFFSPGCSACVDQLRAFVEFAESEVVRALAVVVGDASEAADFVAKLSRVATVVVEPLNGDLSKAFKIRGFPAFCAVDGSGAVIASGWAVSDISTTAQREPIGSAQNEK